MRNIAVPCLTLGIILGVSSSVATAQQVGELTLSDVQVDVDRITPQSRSGDAMFSVDAATTVITIHLICNLDEVTTEIAYPGGQNPITPANVDQFGGSYMAYDIDPGDTSAALALPTLDGPGFHYVYAFDSQGAGDYTVSFEGPVDFGTATEAVVITMMHTDTPINAALLPTPERAPSGQDVILTAFVFNDDQPVTGATVSARVQEPGEEAFGTAEGPHAEGCESLDFDADADVDLADFAGMQILLPGPG